MTMILLQVSTTNLLEANLNVWIAVNVEIGCGVDSICYPEIVAQSVRNPILDRAIDGFTSLRGREVGLVMPGANWSINRWW